VLYEASMLCPSSRGRDLFLAFRKRGDGRRLEAETDTSRRFDLSKSTLSRVDHIYLVLMRFVQAHSK
jgi:hypothetical protein